MAGLLAGYAAAAHTDDSLYASVGMAERDHRYEQYLHYQASTENTLTPLQAIRWIRSLMGQAPSSRQPAIQFDPQVDAYQTQVRAVARFSYKF